MKEHVLTTRVRFPETDRMGVVYHANYIVYFELGRTELMRAAGLAYSEFEKTGRSLVVTEIGARYRAGARYDEELAILTRVSEIGHATVRFDYTVTSRGKVLAEGYTTLACLNSAGKPTRLPEDVVARLR